MTKGAFINSIDAGYSHLLSSTSLAVFSGGFCHYRLPTVCAFRIHSSIWNIFFLHEIGIIWSTGTSREREKILRKSKWVLQINASTVNRLNQSGSKFEKLPHQIYKRKKIVHVVIERSFSWVNWLAVYLFCNTPSVPHSTYVRPEFHIKCLWWNSLSHKTNAYPQWDRLQKTHWRHFVLKTVNITAARNKIK